MKFEVPICSFCVCVVACIHLYVCLAHLLCTYIHTWLYSPLYEFFENILLKYACATCRHDLRCSAVSSTPRKITPRTASPLAWSRQGASQHECLVSLMYTHAHTHRSVRTCSYLLILLQVYYSKAVHYTLLVTAASFIQVLLLVRQIEYTNSTNAANKVSLFTIGHQVSN